MTSCNKKQDLAPFSCYPGSMEWIYLVIAGILEVGWAIGMKQSEGFTKLVPSIWTIILMVISFALLAQAVKVLPIGTSYAVWTGIGAIGTVIAGMLIFHEPRDFWRLTFMSLILIGIVGLKWTSRS